MSSASGIALHEYDSVGEFLNCAVEGQCVVLNVNQPNEVVRVLTHYHACKSVLPQRTAAYFALPKAALPTAATKRMHPMHTLQCSDGDDMFEYVVYYDPPAFANGTYKSCDLPPAVQQLRTAPMTHIVNNSDDVESHDLTFVFSASLAGVPCTALGDSGAKHSFVSKEFAQRHKLHIKQESVPIVLADGRHSSTSGLVYCKLKLQSYQADVSLRVIEMVPGIDVILGDDWFQTEGACIDYGNADSRAYVPASIWLRRKRLRILPNRLANTDDQTSYDTHTGNTTRKVSLLSHVQAARLLTHPSADCAAPYMVLVRDQKPENSQTRDQQVKEIIAEYADVFEAPTVGETQADAPESIRLQPDATAPNRPAFRLSMKERKEVETQVQGLLDDRRIVPSTSAFGAPVLFVPKPDGSLRMCIDYRALNKLTLKNKYPLPRIDDLLDNLGGAKHFTSLDLTSGYHQIGLHPSDWEKTAFNTHIGKYEWRVLPFGLCNAPAIFQATMNRVFAAQLNRFVCVYLDDILIYSRTEAEHLKHLRIVLDVLRQHHYKAKLAKCEFFKQELKFLGHIVSSEGIKPDPAKVQVVNDWPPPRSVYEVRSFLGLANYFRRFIRNYAKVASPLTDLLKGITATDRKGKLLQWGRLSAEAARTVQDTFKQKWSPRCTQAFSQLKDALVSAPVLALPDFSRSFTLVCDACTAAPAVGGILLQDRHPVAFFSKKLSGREAGYSASDIEMLAVIYALREWRCYLEGQSEPFVIETDHQPNTYVDQCTNPHTLKRRARWLYESSAFNYVWKYKPGASNVADPISRAPQHFAVVCSKDSVRTLDSVTAHGQPATVALCFAGSVRGTRPASKGGRKPTNKRKRHQGHTVETEKPIAQVIKGYLVDDLLARCREGCDNMQRSDQKRFDKLRLIKHQDGLYWTSEDRLYIPDVGTLRRECIDAVHSNPQYGHYGVARTIRKVREVFHWERVSVDVAEFVKHCDSCQRIKASHQLPQGELHPLPIPTRRWESVSMDLITDLPLTERGFDTIVVFVDRLSKMVHLAPCTKSVTATELVHLFENNVWKLHGVPSDIVSDRDVRFASFWGLMCEHFGIVHNKSSGKHPQSDGQTENANGVLEDTLRHFVNDSQNNWDTLLPVAEFAMNNAYNSTIQNTPFMLNYGQHPDTPVALFLRNVNPRVNKFVGRWSEQLQIAKRCIEAAQQRQKASANRRRRPAEELVVGDRVLIHIKHFRLKPGLKLKLAPRYLGPFLITEVIGQHKLSFRVELPTPLHRMHNVFHVSSLRKYHGNGPYQPPEIPDVEDSEMFFEVDHISDSRGVPRRQYLVHWVGGGYGWHDAMLLAGCDHHIRDYWRSRSQEPPADAFPLPLERLADLLEGKQAKGGSSVTT